MISRDIKLVDKTSRVFKLFEDYSKIFEKIYIIILAKKQSGVIYEQKWINIYDNIFVFTVYTDSYVGTISAVVKGMRRLKENFDIVTVQDPFEAGFLAFLISKFLGLKIQVQVHTDFLSPHYRRESLVNRLRVLLAKFLLKRADCIRVVSSRIKESIINEIRIKREPYVLPVFVDMDKIAQSFSGIDLKKKYPTARKIILMASRFSPEKNFNLALKTFDVVHKKDNTIGMVIVGDGPEKKNIERFIFDRNMKNIFIEPWQSDILQYYKASDVFLVTSDYEGFGLTIVEALASGTPVVSTDVGIAKVAGAKVVSQRAPEFLAGAIFDVLNNNEKGVLNRDNFYLSKDDYLQKFKDSLVSC